MRATPLYGETLYLKHCVTENSYNLLPAMCKYLYHVLNIRDLENYRFWHVGVLEALFCGFFFFLGFLQALDATQCCCVSSFRNWALVTRKVNWSSALLHVKERNK